MQLKAASKLAEKIADDHEWRVLAIVARGDNRYAVQAAHVGTQYKDTFTSPADWEACGVHDIVRAAAAARPALAAVPQGPADD